MISILSPVFCKTSSTFFNEEITCLNPTKLIGISDVRTRGGGNSVCLEPQIKHLQKLLTLDQESGKDVGFIEHTSIKPIQRPY